MVWNCRYIYGDTNCKLTTGLLRVFCKHCPGVMLPAWDQSAVLHREAVGMPRCNKRGEVKIARCSTGFVEDKLKCWKKMGRWRNLCPDFLPLNLQITATRGTMNMVWRLLMNQSSFHLLHPILQQPATAGALWYGVFMKNLWETGQKNNGDTTLNWKASQYAQLLWGCFLSSSQITKLLRWNKLAPGWSSSR